MQCSVCNQRINGEYLKINDRAVCARCHHPECLCYSCGRQMVPGREMRLADFRTICHLCYADAIFFLDQKIIVELKKSMEKLFCYPAVWPTFEVVGINKLMELAGNSSKTVSGKCITDIEICGQRRRVVAHTILVLFGLPREHCFCVLTHELFHAWLHENVDDGALKANEVEWLCDHLALLFAQIFNFNEQWQKKMQYSRDHDRVSDSFKKKIVSLSVRQLLEHLKSL